MIATMSSPSLSRSSTMEIPRNANAAGAPLPFLPRRTSSASRTGVPLPTATPNRTNPVRITLQRATPPEDDDSSSASSSAASGSSSSGSGRTSRPKRIRGVRNSPPLPVSPTLGLPRSKKEGVAFPSRTQDPNVSDADDNVSAPVLKVGLPEVTPVTSVRMTLEAMSPRTLSESSVSMTAIASAQAKSAPIDSPLPPIAIRKKSGQLVKPSLKSSKSAFKGSLNVSTKGLSTKSEPATPTAKAVHFDAQLEHVKLFLAEQRPIAVSRDGSPTDETSGTESDFPSWIYGGGGGSGNSKKRLTMQVVNMPPSVNLSADIVLEEVKLSPEGNSLVGRVRVRNIAFQKWVTVRFTFDSWQTTSEVTAKYAESAPDNVDIFSFVIRLNDLLARIEEKTMVMALRYNVGGREIWDNNFGGNYIAKFAWQAPPPVAPKFSSGSDSGSDLGGDLRTRLEKVIQKRNNVEEDDDTASSASSNRTPRGQSPDRSFNYFKKSSSLASRYDIGTSLKNPWRQHTTTSTTNSQQRHSRMHSYPLVTSFSSSSIPWPEISSTTTVVSGKGRPPIMPTTKVQARLDLGSPRDRVEDDSFRPGHYAASDLDEAAEAPATHQQRSQRNHTRGYFDVSVLGDGSGVRRTPPSSRRGSVSSETGSGSLTNTSRSYSFPPVDSQRTKAVTMTTTIATTGGLGLGIASLEPPESTSESSSATSDSSSLSSPSDYDVLSGVASPTAVSPSELSPKTSYSQFLDRFCFFTGADENSYFSLIPPSAMNKPRTSSTASVDELFSEPSPRLHDALSSKLYFSPSMALQTCDDSVLPTPGTSGTSTPVSNGFGSDSESRCPTPVVH
ncbi:hypothetical protein K435DRAFT_97030 [Dendrothele bispora CBS 962.96]|uniref:CBM21 domain-containing protein n=1 Tax=Dendrothele bispora (strain CBS 962.96) TaxID=1314807 RepID=A0A4S8M2I3_DENBC|nr:hypothetical protein K435DRAFT_97030 [Dendrothele bispora CBS 962.96]